jgi:mannosyltransferase OCH1-like enzyme
VLRILILMNFGGIYLDNDVYLVNSLDKYRKFEMVISWDADDLGIGNQVFLANRNARFLKAYYDLYRYVSEYS